jgi:prepilin-type N-terminal cleavage/methylation domain-containing protein
MQSDRRAGFSMVELLVALTVLSGSSLALAGATGAVARLSRSTQARGQQAVLAGEASGRLAALPWHSLPSTSSCRSVSGDVALQECISVQVVTTAHRRFTVTVTSSINADTVVVERRRATSGNPFNVP